MGLKSVLIFSQQKKNKVDTIIVLNDSIKTECLDEVIVTHKDDIMSLSKKLFSVQVLKKEDIQKVAANNLTDLLTQNLNITIIPDASTGESSVSMFGLDGQYVKILLDGIPITSNNGIGNNIDISQINLDEVEQVEIVEGAMGVLYGDNAVAGVINVVTKRRQGNKWQIQAFVQEETIGKEYNLSDKGRHIQSLKISNNINDNVNYTLGISRNDFKGFYNIYQGKDYAKIVDGIVDNDTLRGTEWNPKEQITYYANANVNLREHNFFYKLQYFKESVTVFDKYVTGRFTDGSYKVTATDENFNTNRIVNNLTITGPLKGEMDYNLFFSQQNQKRYYQDYTYNLSLQKIDNYNTDDLSQSSDFWFSKGFVSNITPNSSFFNLQLGYEFTWQKGYDAIATGNYSDEVVENKIDNYDFFSAVDFNVNKKLSFYPGARFTNNSQFGKKFIWSLSSTYRISDSFNTKAVFGSAFRTPNFGELFYYFVDANHNVKGNPDLQPEDGISLLLNFDKRITISEGSVLKTALKTYYFNIDSKIADVIVIDDEGKNLYTSANIDNSKIAGISLNNSFSYKNISVSLGATYMGESTTISESENHKSDYLWSFNLQSNFNYNIPSIKTILSGQIKYTGQTQTLLEDDEGGLYLGKTGSFTWFDASIRKDLTKQINLTLGARNIFDIVTVNASDLSSGGHDSNAANSRLFGNGRSYFLKLLFNINLN